MRKLMKPHPPTLANSVMLLQPKFMDLLKQFKPSPNEMYEAFLKLVKTSQSFYPPSSNYFKPVVTNSIVIASLRFEDSKAQELLGVRFLPLISSKDADLIRLLFHHAKFLMLAHSPFTSINQGH